MSKLLVVVCLVSHMSVMILGQDTRIVGGTDAVLGQAPYIASLRDLTDEGLAFGAGHFCGGTLIDQSTIVTAAHCLIDESYVLTKYLATWPG